MGAGDCPGQYYCRLGCFKKWGGQGRCQNESKRAGVWSAQSKFNFKWLLSFSFLLLEHLTCFYSYLYSVSFSYLFGNYIQFLQA